MKKIIVFFSVILLTSMMGCMPKDVSNNFSTEEIIHQDNTKVEEKIITPVQITESDANYEKEENTQEEIQDKKMSYSGRNKLLLLDVSTALDELERILNNLDLTMESDYNDD